MEDILELIIIVAGITLNTFLLFIIARYFFVYYSLKGLKEGYFQKQLLYNALFVSIGILTYPFLWFLGDIFWPLELIALCLLGYFAYVLNVKWTVNLVLPDPFTAPAIGKSALPTPVGEGEKVIKIAQSHFRMRRFDSALQYYQEAIRLQPNSPIPYYDLACIFSLQKNKDEAYDYLHKAVEAGFTDFDKIRSNPDLAYIVNQPEFIAFEQNGYTIPTNHDASITLAAVLEKLTLLEQHGMITDMEIQFIKKKLISSENI